MSSEPEQRTILIVDDHRLFAEAIQPALSAAGLRVLGVAPSAREALEILDRERPDLVLMDIGLPDADGLELARSLLERDPDQKIVIVTAIVDAQLVRQTVAAGLSGYITKDTPVAQFVAAVNTALAGEVVIPKRLARRSAGFRSEEEEEALQRARYLTPRELEVLQMLSEGCSSQEVAKRLHISLHTVRTHIQNILTKLQVHTRLEAVTFAARYGIVKQPGRSRSAVS